MSFGVVDNFNMPPYSGSTDPYFGDTGGDVLRVILAYSINKSVSLGLSHWMFGCQL